MYVLSNSLKQADVLRERFEYAIQQLEDEIRAYPNDWMLWIKEADIQNSAGNLSLALIRLFKKTAAFLSGEDPVAKIESTAHFIPKDELIKKVSEAGKLLLKAIEKTSMSLEREFPLPYGNSTVAASAYFTYLLTEIFFQLGQINYHRKLV
jgi:hypothetical protein